MDKNKLVLKKSVKLFITKVMITVVVFMSSLILVKNNALYKDIINTKVYMESFDFSVFRNFYEKYFSSIKILDNIIVEERVFSEELAFDSVDSYLNGVSLDVNLNYMVPSIESGIVVFIGDVEGYGNTIIIEGIDGVDISYSNIDVNGINIYDYIEKGEVIGITIEDNLKLVFQKDGEYLDYKNFI